MRVFVTGSSSCVASVLLPRLCEDPLVTKVTGIDLKPSHFKHAKFNAERMDIRKSGVSTAMQGHDAVIHLAFIIKRHNMTLKKMYDINVNGGKHIVDAAVNNHITKFINMSSTCVYGSGLDLTEDCAYNPCTHFHYALHKTALEKYLNQACPHVIHLRPQVVLGTHAQLALKQLAGASMYIKFKEDVRPRQQVIHEQDLVNAIMLALKTNTSGGFNLSAPEIVDLAGSFIKKDRKAIGIPFAWVNNMIKLSQKLTFKGEFNLSELILNDSTVDCTRAHDILGWQAEYSAWEARDEAIASLFK